MEDYFPLSSKITFIQKEEVCFYAKKSCLVLSH